MTSDCKYLIAVIFCLDLQKFRKSKYSFLNRNVMQINDVALHLLLVHTGDVEQKRKHFSSFIYISSLLWFVITFWRLL